MNKKVIINDKMQKGFYYLTEEEGKNFNPQFKPELTPKEMLSLGVFGGKYMRDCKNEFPEDWFINAKFTKGKKDSSINFFKVDASSPLSVWKKNGWIYPADPRGWFQWYCRYYMGRRLLDEDERQIKRWFAMRRHISALKKNCAAMSLDCRPKQRQALLHWAYDARKI